VGGLALAVQEGRVFGFGDVATNRQMVDLTTAVCNLNAALCSVPTSGGNTPNPGGGTQPPQTCATLITAPELVADHELSANGASVGASSTLTGFPVTDIPDGQGPSACKAQCDAERNCAAWGFQPKGAFLTHIAKCFKFDASAAFFKPSFSAGIAFGIKGGTRQIQLGQEDLQPGACTYPTNSFTPAPR
jgi:hypothetical protein